MASREGSSDHTEKDHLLQHAHVEPESMASREGSSDHTEKDCLLQHVEPEVDKMKAKLPTYIVNCFMVSGFDLPEVVAAMDVSSNRGNSIEQIEQFVLSNFSNDPKYMGCLAQAKKFTFPPGHRLCIVYRGLSISRTHTTADKLGAMCTWLVTSDYRHFEQWDSINSTTPCSTS